MSTILKVAKKVKINKIIEKIIDKPIRNTNNFKKDKFQKKYIVKETFINDHQVLTLTRNIKFKNHIIFLHGGAYRDEALIVHRIFVERILDKYDVKVSFLDYPLIPEHNHTETQVFTYKSILYLKDKYKEDKFFMLGDSAGGGLCISMLQKLNRKEIFITSSVLLSPWVDVSMSNPKIKKQIEKDYTLSYDNLVDSGKIYAGNIKTTSKIVSPIYGKLNNLGKLLIYVSDNELLYPDIIKFKKLVDNEKNSLCELVIGKDLCHDYPLLLLKENKKVTDEIMKFILN